MTRAAIGLMTERDRGDASSAHCAATVPRELGGPQRFLAAVVIALLAAACGGDDGGSSDADAGGGSFSIMNTDSSTHTHTLTILCVDLTGEAPVTYTTSVADSHTHSVMLTGDDVMRIADGETVTITFTDGHEHTFIIVKPAGECD